MVEWNMCFLCPLELDQTIVIENNVKGFTLAYDLRFFFFYYLLVLKQIRLKLNFN